MVNTEKDGGSTGGAWGHFISFPKPTDSLFSSTAAAQMLLLLFQLEGLLECKRQTNGDRP